MERITEPSASLQKALACGDKYNCCLRALRQHATQPLSVALFTFVACAFSLFAGAMLPWPMLLTLFLVVVPPATCFMWLPLPRAVCEAPTLAAVREFVTQGRELDLTPLYNKQVADGDAVSYVNALYLEGIRSAVMQK